MKTNTNNNTSNLRGLTRRIAETEVGICSLLDRSCESFIQYTITVNRTYVCTKKYSARIGSGSRTRQSRPLVYIMPLQPPAIVYLTVLPPNTKFLTDLNELELKEQHNPNPISV